MTGESPIDPSTPLGVLVVEDDDDYRESLELAVRCLGYSCRAARDGVEAWEMFEACQPDVILSDWTMPNMDGLELCQKVRAADDLRRSHTHFMFITGNNEKAQIRSGRQAGADDHIPKPVDLNNLQACLEAARRVRMLRGWGATVGSTP